MPVCYMYLLSGGRCLRAKGRTVPWRGRAAPSRCGADGPTTTAFLHAFLDTVPLLLHWDGTEPWTNPLVKYPLTGHPYHPTGQWSPFLSWSYKLLRRHWRQVAWQDTAPTRLLLLPKAPTLTKVTAMSQVWGHISVCTRFLHEVGPSQRFGGYLVVYSHIPLSVVGVGLDGCTCRPSFLTGIISCGTSLQDLVSESSSSHLVGTS